MSVDKEISRRLSEINAEAARLERNLKNVSAQNKLVDKSMQFSADPFSTLVQKSDNLKRAVAEATNQLQLLKEKETIVEGQFKNGEITQNQYDRLKNQIMSTENQLNEFARELDNTNDQIKNFRAEELSGKFKNIGTAVSNAGRAFAPFSAAAAGVLAIGGKLTQSAMEQGAAIDDLAQRYQVSALTVQRWQYVAMQCGVEAEVLTKSYVKARAAMLDLDSGKINEQSKAVSALGININDFANSEEAFEGLINALANLKDGTQQVTLANEIFGDKIASTLLPLLNAGKDNLKMFTDQFAELNPLTDEQVSKLAALDDQMYKNKETLKNTALQIGASLTPVIQSLLNLVEEKVLPKFKALSEHFANLSDGTKNLAVGVLVCVAALAPFLMLGGKVISGIGTIISIIPKLSGMLSVLSAHPIIAIIGIISVLVGTLYMKNEQFRNSINNMMQMLSKLAMPIMNIVQTCLSVVLELIGGIVDALGGPLAQVIEVICKLLQPLIDMLVWVIEAAEKVINVGATIVGKGWLWGKDDKNKKSRTNSNALEYQPPSFDFNAMQSVYDVPDLNANATNYNSTVDNYSVQNEIVINAAGMSEEDLEKAITQAFNKQMLAKYLAFR